MWRADATEDFADREKDRERIRLGLRKEGLCVHRFINDILCVHRFINDMHNVP